MPTLSEPAIASLLAPYLHPKSHLPLHSPVVPPDLYPQLSFYLDLLLKWNARTNLTAIREPEEIVKRHFGESLFAGVHLGACPTLLDFGSGAGFPGLPIAILRPDISVTLAESQNKKATFLREVVRTLGLRAEIWADRVENMPPERQFHTVTLRAVDNMSAALAAAAPRTSSRLVLLTSVAPELPAEFSPESSISIPNTNSGLLFEAVRI
jgi:16S rRNA (guanine527-N7)-methyltransferase